MIATCVPATNYNNNNKQEAKMKSWWIDDSVLRRLNLAWDILERFIRTSKNQKEVKVASMIQSNFEKILERRQSLEEDLMENSLLNSIMIEIRLDLEVVENVIGCPTPYEIYYYLNKLLKASEALKPKSLQSLEAVMDNTLGRYSEEDLMEHWQDLKIKLESGLKLPKDYSVEEYVKILRWFDGLRLYGWQDEVFKVLNLLKIIECYLNELGGLVLYAAEVYVDENILKEIQAELLLDWKDFEEVVKDMKEASEERLRTLGWIQDQEMRDRVRNQAREFKLTCESLLIQFDLIKDDKLDLSFKLIYDMILSSFKLDYIINKSNNERMKQEWIKTSWWCSNISNLIKERLAGVWYFFEENLEELIEEAEVVEEEIMMNYSEEDLEEDKVLDDAFLALSYVREYMPAELKSFYDGGVFDSFEIKEKMNLEELRERLENLESYLDLSTFRSFFSAFECVVDGALGFVFKLNH